MFSYTTIVHYIMIILYTEVDLCYDVVQLASVLNKVLKVPDHIYLKEVGDNVVCVHV